MVEDELKNIMDRAAGPGDLPPGLVEAVVAGSRARRRRRAGTAAAGLAAVAAAAVLLVPAAGGLLRAPGTPVVTGGPPTAEPFEQVTMLTRLGRVLGAPVDASRIIAAADVPGMAVVALTRRAHPGQGKAAEVWVERGGRSFRMATDYLTYDSGCVSGDAVCAQVEPSGLGFFTVVRLDGDRAYVLVRVPDGRRVEVRSGGRTWPVTPDEQGGGVLVTTEDPHALVVRVYLADGRYYQLAHQPGIVVTG